MAASFPIHIIDDGMELCLELCRWLEQAGHTVIRESPVRLTLAGLAAEPPALLVVAVPDGNSDGLAFYQRLAAHRQLRHVPVIAVSNDPDLEYELLDAYDFQARPFDRRRLLTAVERLIQAAGKGRPPLLAHLDSEQLDPFRDLLLQRSGLHFSASNQRLLERGLLHRMQALQMTSPGKYRDYLARSADNQDELNKLLGLLTVGETCFFRYRTHREAMARSVLPALLEQGAATRRLRIWSAGCSTGEEPYSLAMILLEHCPQLLDWDVQILATDINKRALRQAREGIYRSRALRQTDERLLERYFRKVGDHFVLDQRVRSLVRFSYLNLQADPYPHAENGTRDLDLIFCRNVLIYFQAETIRQIIGRFSNCLRPQGYLFLGHAETLQGISDRFQRLHQHGAFFYQRKLQEKGHTALPLPKVPMPPLPAAVPAKGPEVPSAKAVSPVPEVEKASSSPAPLPRPDRDRVFAAAMAAFDRENFTAAEKLTDQLLADYPEDAPALVGKGLILANQGRYDEARQWCARAIRYDDLYPAAYLLRGLILDMEGQLERALVEYQKVLWLDREFVMAYYFSAKINSRLGQVDQQLRALRNAIRLLEKQTGGGVIPFSGGVSRPVMLEICRKELSAIQP